MISPRRLTLLKKGLLLIALSLIYQAILLGVLMRQQHLHTETQRLVVHTKDVLLQLDLIWNLLQKSQSDLRAYLLGAGEPFVTSTNEAVSNAAAQVDVLARMIDDHDVQSQRLNVLRERVRERAEYSRSVIDDFRGGNQAKAIERVRRLEGQEIMDRIADEVEKMRVVEEELDRERREELRKTSARQNGVLVAGLILNVLVAAGSAMYFSRMIGARLTQLSDNMQRIVRGDTLIPALGGEDELGALDAGLHDMAQELSDSRASERAVQQALERRNHELTRANRELDHKNQENEMFVYSVSHDLRSPLVNLQGFSKELGLVRQDLEAIFSGNLDEQARERGRTLVQRDIGESIHYIQTAVSRLSTIIDALLRLSRAGRIEYHPELVDLNQTMTRIIEAMRSTVEQKGAIIKVEPLPVVWGEPTALEQVFANLIGNAVNYLDPKRPGRIEVKQVPAPSEDYEGQNVFAVTDNGLGIPEAYLPKVFGVFQRLHPNVAPGEGIGLPLVRRMVERHGGSVWVESKEGEGSTFFVSLPAKERSPLVVAPRKESIRFSPRL